MKGRKRDQAGAGREWEKEEMERDQWQQQNKILNAATEHHIILTMMITINSTDIYNLADTKSQIYLSNSTNISRHLWKKKSVN